MYSEEHIGLGPWHGWPITSVAYTAERCHSCMSLVFLLAQRLCVRGFCMVATILEKPWNPWNLDNILENPGKFLKIMIFSKNVLNYYIKECKLHRENSRLLQLPITYVFFNHGEHILWKIMKSLNFGCFRTDNSEFFKKFWNYSQKLINKSRVDFI